MAFSTQIEECPSSERVQSIVRQWVKCFEGFFQCDNEILMCIARSYKFDNRFKRHIDQYSDGDLSDFIYRAVIHYCEFNNC